MRKPSYFTLTGWSNFAKSYIGYVHSPHLRWVALQYLHETGYDLDTLIKELEETIDVGIRTCEFNPHHYIDELKNIKRQREV